MTYLFKMMVLSFSILSLLSACGGGGGGGGGGGQPAVFLVTPSLSVNSNGNISPDVPVQVTAGGSTLFRINSTPGFKASVGGTCPGTLVESTYTVGPVTSDCTVLASFTPITYTVTPQSGQNGTIAPSTPQAVISGSPSTFIITPGSGHSIVSVSGCGGTLSGNTYTTAPITGDCSVSASFALNQYNITSQVSGGGRLSCQSPVTSGGSSSCTETPDAGYRLFLLSDNGTDVMGLVSGGTYNLSNIVANHDIVAAFTLKQFSVVPSTTNGSLSSATSPTVSYGATKDFIATPNNGYAIAAVSGSCGGTLSGNTYTTAPIVNDCTASVSFSPIAYSVATQAGTGGTVTATSQQPIYYNSTPSYTVTPSSGHSIVSVSGCGGTLSGNTFTTAPITGDCSVSASFVPNQYTVTSRVAGGGGGQVSCQTPVTFGGSSTCTETPDVGYQLFMLSDNGSDVMGLVSSGRYNLSNISASHDIVAAFTLKQLSVVPATTNGSLSPATAQTVPYGSTKDFIATPNNGYAISAVSGNCGGTLSGNTYTTAPVAGDCTASVSFSPIAYTVATQAGSGGTVTATSQQSIYYNSTPSFTITPNSGYNIGQVSGCGGTLSGNTFTTAAITGNCTVSASFSPIQYSTGILSLSITSKPASLGFLEVDIPLPAGVQPASMTPGEPDKFDISASVAPTPLAATYTASTNTMKLLFLDYNSGLAVGNLAAVNLVVAPLTFVTPASFPPFATVVSATDTNTPDYIINPSAVITVQLSATLN